MKTFSLDGSRTLVLATAEEIAFGPLPAAPYALLLATSAASPTEAEQRVIGVLAQPLCREMCFLGPSAESVHDLADEIVEARGLLEIVTTWLTKDTPDEAALYFLECASRHSSLLLAAVEHDQPVVAALEAAALGSRMSGTNVSKD